MMDNEQAMINALSANLPNLHALLTIMLMLKIFSNGMSSSYKIIEPTMIWRGITIG